HSVNVSGVASIGPAIATATTTAVASGASLRNASTSVATRVDRTRGGMGPYRVELSKSKTTSSWAKTVIASASTTSGGKPAGLRRSHANASGSFRTRDSAGAIHDITPASYRPVDLGGSSAGCILPRTDRDPGMTQCRPRHDDAPGPPGRR